MKKSLFEKLTLENQSKFDIVKDLDLMNSLHAKNFFMELTSKDLFELSIMFELDKYDISFTSAMLQISNLFNS
jgi:hypothetical protein